MKRTPLLTPALDEPKSLKITYRRSIPMQDEGSLGDIVVDVTDGDRYIKAPTGWHIVPDSPLLRNIDDSTLQGSGTVATGKFRKKAVRSVHRSLLGTMRGTGTLSCHYENGDLCNGWAK